MGLGGDIGGIGADQWPLGMDHTGHLPRLTAELLGRGYDEDSLRCILSDNWRRVYRECLPPAPLWSPRGGGGTGYVPSPVATGEGQGGGRPRLTPE